MKLFRILFPIVNTFCVVLLILSIGLFSTTNKANAAFYCGSTGNNGSNPPQGNCYGAVYWAQYGWGAETTIQIVSMTASNNQDILVDNSLWLKDNTNPDNQYCTYGNGYCYIQVGEMASSKFAGSCLSPQNLALFWADNRPGGGNYNVHLESCVSSDYLNGNLYVTIDPHSPPVAYDYDVTFTVVPPVVTGFNNIEQSTNNSIFPDGVVLGQELSGSTYLGSASASFSVFNDNRWLDRNFNWNYESTTGGQVHSYPPYSDWLYQPGNNTGGTYYTQCGPINVTSNCQ